MKSKKIISLLLVLIMVLSIGVTVYASANNEEPEVNFIEKDPDQPSNNTNETDTHIENQQKLLEQNRDRKVDPSNLREELKEKEISPLNEKPSFNKDPIKEYQRVKIQRLKNLSLDELLKKVEHPEIIPSTPEEAGFDPEDDREFFYFTTKKGNKYYLIKDNLSNRETLTLVTEASEADLLSLLADSESTDEIITQEEDKLKEQKREEERKRLDEERKKYNEELKKEKENEVKDKDKKILSFNNIKWGVIGIGAIILLLGLKNIFKSSKKEKYYEEDDEEYEVQDIDDTENISDEENIYEEEDDEE